MISAFADLVGDVFHDQKVEILAFSTSWREQSIIMFGGNSAWFKAFSASETDTVS